MCHFILMLPGLGDHGELRLICVNAVGYILQGTRDGNILIFLIISEFSTGLYL